MFNLSASVDTPEYIPQWMRQKKKAVNDASTTKPATDVSTTTTVVSPAPVQISAPVNTTVTPSSYFASPPHLLPPQIPNHCVPYSEFTNSLLPPPPLPMMLVPTPPPQMPQPPFSVHSFQINSTFPHDISTTTVAPSSSSSAAGAGAFTSQAPPPPTQLQPSSGSSISVTRTANNSISTLDHRPPFHPQQVHNSHLQSTQVIEVHSTHVKGISELPPLPSSPPTHLNSGTNSSRATPVMSAAHSMSLISKRVPARMSPAVTPSSMNPNALEFVPGRNLFTSSLTEHTSLFNQTHSSNMLLPSTSSGSSTFAHSASTALSLLPASTMMNHGGLEALPSSTADIEAAEEHEQRRKSESKENTERESTLRHTNHKSESKASDPIKHNSNGHDRASAPGLPVKPSPLWRPSHVHSLTTSPIIAAATVLQQKTEKEILEISERSALNASAAAYMPKRTMTRLVLTKPSPLTLVPSADPTEANTSMMLDDLWCLYYLPVNMNNKTITKEAEFNPVLVFRIESIPTLWKVFNNIPTPSEMRPSTLYLFRDGIDPKWEHLANRDGGIVKVKISHDQIDEAWELLLCRVMGNSWAASIRDTVNGVVLKVRERAYFLEIWVTKQTPELMKDLAELWQPILGATFTAVYYTHASIQERAEAAASVLAERQRKQRKRH